MIRAVEISLRAFFRDGTPVTADDFLTPLGLTPEDRVIAAVSDRGAWQSALITFGRFSIEDFQGRDDPSDALVNAITETLIYVSGWLTARLPVLQRMHKAELTIDLFLDFLIDQDQFEMSLPSKLLLACGQIGLAIEVVTND